jgi:TolB protein
LDDDKPQETEDCPQNLGFFFSTSRYNPAMRRFFYGILLLVGMMAGVAQVNAQGRADRSGWLVTARRIEGQSDLWAIPATGGAWQQLTSTPDDERSPAFHPNGHTVAYEARRNRNWDIYTLDLRTGEETRLTSNPHFEGYPAWSPDGTQLAFASMREGELDVFVLDVETGAENNLTPTSAAHDFEPRWEDNDTLLFVSTRSKSHDIFRLTLGDEAPTPVIKSATEGEREVQVVPNGLWVIIQEGRIRTLQRHSRAGTPIGDGISWTQTILSAAASPDGQSVAWLEKRYDGVMLYQQMEGEGIQELAGPLPFLEGLAWGTPTDAWMDAQLAEPPAIVATPTPQTQRSQLVWIDDLETLQPELNQRVVESYTTLRGRIAGEIGFDFLGELSESVRPINWDSEGSDYLSWHKSGRAFDTLLDAGYRGDYPIIELVRQDQHGEIYWEFWLRCPTQDGSCGEPLIDAPWDFSYEARWEIAPGQGGIPKSFVPGYYVNFTRYAEDAGWERITSYETPTFDWRENNIAAEFWHYQYTGGLKWYQGMQELLTPAEIEEYFGWQVLRERDIARWKLKTKGIPLPSEIRNAPAEMVVP